jgi:hypothetical protein
LLRRAENYCGVQKKPAIGVCRGTFQLSLHRHTIFFL